VKWLPNIGSRRQQLRRCGYGARFGRNGAIMVSSLAVTAAAPEPNRWVAKTNRLVEFSFSKWASETGRDDIK